MGVFSLKTEYDFYIASIVNDSKTIRYEAELIWHSRQDLLTTVVENHSSKSL